MTRIDTASRIAAVIRRQADMLRDAARAAAAGSGSTRTGAARSETLADVVARRIGAIDAADPDRRRKAFRVFLESVLLAELGEALINDPAFYQIVDQVLAAMEADEELAPAIDEAAGLLLGGRV